MYPSCAGIVLTALVLLLDVWVTNGFSLVTTSVVPEQRPLSQKPTLIWSESNDDLAMGILVTVRRRKWNLLRTAMSSGRDGNDDDDDIISQKSNKNDEERDGATPEGLRRRAEELREQIRKLESQLGERKRNYNSARETPSPPSSTSSSVTGPVDAGNIIATDDPAINSTAAPTLHNQQILVVGANGRLGSMVCRYLLRNYPQTKVVAAVHYVSENSPTARGYGRLSYEVGAEDGIGRIGSAWDRSDRTATFEYDPDTMQDYNLRNIRIVECELLDPVQCLTIAQGCDAVIWCATDFDGNIPRSVSGFNPALLFRAVTRVDKGRVEIEGLEHMLAAIRKSKQDKKWTGVSGATLLSSSSSSSLARSEPINFVHVSVAPEAFDDFETPFGSFIDLKRQGERMVKNQSHSLSYTILRISQFDDLFVGEDLPIQTEATGDEGVAPETATTTTTTTRQDKSRRRINRRDAAKAVVEALINKDLMGKTVEVWTATR